MLQRDSVERVHRGLCPRMNTAAETLITSSWPLFPSLYLKLPKQSRALFFFFFSFPGLYFNYAWPRSPQQRWCWNFQQLLFLFSSNRTADLHCVRMTKMTASPRKCKWLPSASMHCTTSLHLCCTSYAAVLARRCPYCYSKWLQWTTPPFFSFFNPSIVSF